MSPAQNAVRLEVAARLAAIAATDALDAAIVQHQLLPALLDDGVFIDDADIADEHGVAHTTVARRRKKLAERHLPDADIDAIGAIYSGRRASGANDREK